MKYILILSLLVGNLGYGQFFDDTANFQESYESNNEPDQGQDQDGDVDPAPGDSDDVPINHWTFLLPLAGLVVGGFYLQRKREIL